MSRICAKWPSMARDRFAACRQDVIELGHVEIAACRPLVGRALSHQGRKSESAQESGRLGMRTESWTLGRPDWSPHVFDGGSAQGR